MTQGVEELSVNLMQRTHLALVASLLTAALAFSALPATAHPGHAPPIIEIVKPALVPGQNVNGVPVEAVLVGSSEIQVKWTCPPQSTYWYVEIVVRDANGAVVGQGVAPPGAASPWSWWWGASSTGIYTIAAKVKCYHNVQDPRGGVRQVLDGEDTHAKTVAAVPL